MSRIALKKKLAAELPSAPFSKLGEILSPYKEQQLLNPLFSFICSVDEVLRWRAVSAFGIIVPRIAEKNIESARMIMRRFLWSLNDESGGIGWGAPESMAEIMCFHEGLRGEYLHMLLSYLREDGDEPFQDGNQLELPQLQQGALWGVGRLAEKYPDLLREEDIIADLLPYLDSGDLQVVGLALRIFYFLKEPLSVRFREKCLESTEIIRVYEDGEFSDISLGSIVESFLSL
ncbi:DVU0298 family protein [Desulfotalea psychrophila]|uniref:HEAT repeat domain-containing protein n=1 Tax=Desulfotalea psychrophila (strain LSv54 / DSM 12343) TaxID=177439 RepID=Q6AKA1_DESPS|nr:DVU0298 family protein [Desulfotalea psychrophila]CAG37225.1 unknown protein [Desulfotalea psychrophila LSv54]